MKDKHVLAFMRVFSILVLFAVFFSSSLAESNGTQIVHVPFVDVPILETHRTSFLKIKDMQFTLALVKTMCVPQMEKLPFQRMMLSRLLPVKMDGS